MDYLFLIGRIIFGGYFIIQAWNHFTKTAGYAGYAASKGVPNPMLAVILTGILLLIGGLGIVLGIYVHLACASLALFLIPVTFVMHAYWQDNDPNMKASNRVNFGKNMALLGALMMIAMIQEPWPFSL